VYFECCPQFLGKIFASLGFSKVYLSVTKLYMTVQGEEKIYKIGQAAKLVGLKSYVLRFWEGEFEQLEPIRTPSGQRLYSEEHIALISRIKALLHDEGLTIEGARKRLDSPDEDLKENQLSESSSGLSNNLEQLPLFSSDEVTSDVVDKNILMEVHAELLELKNLLS